MKIAQWTSEIAQEFSWKTEKLHFYTQTQSQKGPFQEILESCDALRHGIKLAMVDRMVQFSKSDENGDWILKAKALISY